MRPSASLMLLLIQPAEIFEHHAPLLGRETGQLVPRGVAEFRTRAGRARQERARNVGTVTRRRPTGTVLLLIGLVSRQTAARVEQFSIEALLPFDRAAVEPPRFKLAGELARFLREGTGRSGIAARLQSLELFGQLALAAGKLTQALHHRVAARAHHREQPLRVAVHALLLLRHAGELLEGFLEAGSRLRPGDALRGPHERVRGRVEGVECLLGEGRGGRRTWVALLELLARLLHLILRVPERRLELR